MPGVFLFATLDTKGHEAAFVRGLLASLGVPVTLVDVGALGSPVVVADIPRERIFELAGTTLGRVRQKADRGEAVTKAAEGAARLAREAYARGDVSGVLGLGGSAGTTIGTAAMRALPLGVPKVMVSTLASGMVRQYVGDKDIFMLNAVADIIGLNRVSRPVLSQAARAMAGLVQHAAPEEHAADKPIVAATMFGVTTPCIDRARETLERAGYEVLVFHATGNGGQAMESLITEGCIAGVLDITTTELADERVGGVLSAGPDRLTAAARMGIPQVVSTGALDMVNFHALSTVPVAFKDRRFYRHNANVTLMRTTPEENAAIGIEMATKLSAARGPVAILLPARGVSAIDKTGQPFDDPVARAALHDAIRSGAHGQEIEVVDLDMHINDPEFADAAVRKLLELMAAAPSAEPRSREAASPGRKGERRDRG
ncbi:MAG: Tm-1-like ATP-binding domain-containing protein [Vicinamibacterales bacterium]